MHEEATLYDKNISLWPKRKQAEFWLRIFYYGVPQFLSAFASEDEKDAFFRLEFFDRAMWKTLPPSERERYEREHGIGRE